MVVSSLPPSLALGLTELSLLTIGIAVEKHYVSRVSSFTNGIALVIHVLSQENVGLFLEAYTDFGVLLGIIGLAAYIREQSLPQYYYYLTFFLYSSLNAGLIILLTPGQLLLAVPLGIGGQFLLLYFWGGDWLVHTGDYSGAVKHFHQKYEFEFTDAAGRQVIDLSDWFD